MSERIKAWRIGRWRREAAERHCEMLRETVQMLLAHGPRQHPLLAQHAQHVLDATTRRERELIGVLRGE